MSRVREDPWVSGVSVAALAPPVLKLVRPGPARSRTVQQGMQGNAWVRDIQGVLTVDAVVQYLRLWPLIQSVTLRADAPDVFTWKFSASGEFATRPSYLACFAGRTALPATGEVWHSFAPTKHCFFGWLAIQGRCWTADRLQRRRLPNHGNCTLCQAAPEDINHLLMQCLYSRAVWFNLLRLLGLQHFLLGDIDCIADWWPIASSRVVGTAKRSFNSLCLLVMRAIWMERNACVFQDTACLASSLSARVSDEWKEWIRCHAMCTSRYIARVGGQQE
ncbi:hypothetical protein ACQ4PT_025976 [Festuca glaucescens]